MCRPPATGMAWLAPTRPHRRTMPLAVGRGRSHALAFGARPAQAATPVINDPDESANADTDECPGSGCGRNRPPSRIRRGLGNDEPQAADPDAGAEDEAGHGWVDVGDGSAAVADMAAATRMHGATTAETAVSTVPTAGSSGTDAPGFWSAADSTMSAAPRTARPPGASRGQIPHGAMHPGISRELTRVWTK